MISCTLAPGSPCGPRCAAAAEPRGPARASVPRASASAGSDSRWAWARAPLRGLELVGRLRLRPDGSGSGCDGSGSGSDGSGAGSVPARARLGAGSGSPAGRLGRAGSGSRPDGSGSGRDLAPTRRADRGGKISGRTSAPGPRLGDRIVPLKEVIARAAEHRVRLVLGAAVGAGDHFTILRVAMPPTHGHFLPVQEILGRLPRGDRRPRPAEPSSTPSSRADGTPRLSAPMRRAGRRCAKSPMPARHATGSGGCIAVSACDLRCLRRAAIGRDRSRPSLNFSRRGPRSAGDWQRVRVATSPRMPCRSPGRDTGPPRRGRWHRRRDLRGVRRDQQVAYRVLHVLWRLPGLAGRADPSGAADVTQPLPPQAAARAASRTPATAARPPAARLTVSLPTPLPFRSSRCRPPVSADTDRPPPTAPAPRRIRTPATIRQPGRSTPARSPVPPQPTPNAAGRPAHAAAAIAPTHPPWRSARPANVRSTRVAASAGTAARSSSARARVAPR